MNDKREHTTDSIFKDLSARIVGLIGNTSPRDRKLQSICDVLKAEIPHYDWVGFYIVSGPQMLSLGPYAGASTDHAEIPFGRGICGQVAESEETFLIQDVSKEDNYLSCSVNVKSEIVVPIFKDGEFVAQLDIDSHTVAPFTDADKGFLEGICKLIGDLF
ncbi:MAG: GAF domain-containing protein [bacterium]|nr:GAF domain-containing protein [bacterium]